MKVLLDDYINKELIEYLLTQEGILEVKLNEIDMFMEVAVKHNEKITASVIMKYIELFQDNKFSTMIAFNKENNTNLRKLKYNAGDICCEYCYMGFVKEMFNKKEIVSLKSNYNLYDALYNIEFEIEYDENYNEEELLKYIKENI